MSITTRHPTHPRLATGLYTSLWFFSPKPSQFYWNNSLVDTELRYSVQTTLYDSGRLPSNHVWTPGVIVPPSQRRQLLAFPATHPPAKALWNKLFVLDHIQSLYIPFRRCHLGLAHCLDALEATSCTGTMLCDAKACTCTSFLSCLRPPRCLFLLKTLVRVYLLTLPRKSGVHLDRQNPRRFFPVDFFYR